MKLTKNLLIWYLLSCIQLLVIIVAVMFDFHKVVWQHDNTKLSFLIFFIWIVSTIFIGYLHALVDKFAIKRFSQIGWYLAETCSALGMLGTVAGFLMMLGTAFLNIDVSNTTKLQAALSFMASGMSTALYTTLVGLMANIFIKSQLVSLEHYADGLA